MKEIKYIHAANLCLDAPFQRLDRGVPGRRIQQLLVSAPIRAMERLIELCIEEKVTFLIITGELLLHSPADPKLRNHAANCLKKLSEAKIPVLFSQPITDPLLIAICEQEIPGVFIFSNTNPQTYSVLQNEECKALIQSFGNPSGKTVEEYLPLLKSNPECECFQAAIMPFAISPEFRDSPAICPVSSLAQTGFDAIIPGMPQPHAILNSHPFVAAPGPLLNHDFEQPGPHGCLLVHARKEADWKCVGKFKNLSPIIFQELYLNVSGVKSANQFKSDLINGLKNIQSTLEGTYSTIIVNCRLTGETVLNNWLYSDAFRAEIQEIFSHFANGRSPILLHELMLETGISQKTYERDDLVGEVFRLGRQIMTESDKLEIYRAAALESFSENPELSQMIGLLDADSISSLISDAMHVCQHVLEED